MVIPPVIVNVFPATGVGLPLLVSKISIIGVGMVTTPGVTFRMFQALANQKINIQVISTSEIKISVLVNKIYVKKAISVLHKEFKLEK